MADLISGTHARPLGGQCECGRNRFPINISDISCEGCWAEATGDWEDAYDFLHLTIDERIEINGKVVSLDGPKAWIRFFGELHPAVVAGLGKAA
ncbi:hypothetical protein [Aurantiacibacter rhizosphaerae]|uniref:Uncharacterized protein n=1 Tax=Aurantiacibacter rhizosphaerae TaxID=2691582 RepID=A0A844XAY4_9SPHN|nr:hypothetical protein [Aurantiacibacter rhizosphaerae]MWV26685.1 hypothetical protein [Aurantiacibacter rhizosphaerae]